MARQSPASIAAPQWDDGEAPAPLSPGEEHMLAVFEQLVSDLRTMLLEDRDGAAEPDRGSTPSTGRSGRGQQAREAIGARANKVARVLLFARRHLSAMVAGVEQKGTEVPLSMLTAALEFFCPEKGDWLDYHGRLVNSLLEDEGRERFSERLAEDLAYHIRLAELGQVQGTLRRDVEPSALGTFMHRFSVGWAMMVWLRGAPPGPGDIAAQFSGFMQMLQPAAGEAGYALDGFADA